MNLKYLVMAVLAGSTVAAAVAAEEQKPAAPEQKQEDIWSFLPPVVAKVKGKDITKKEFTDFINPMLLGPDGKLHPAITAERLQADAYNAVKGYVDMDLILAEAAKAGIAPSEQLVRDQLKKFMDSMSKEEQDRLKLTFTMSGKTEEQFIDELAKDPFRQRSQATELYLEKEVFGKVQVTDAEAKAYYEANLASFKIPADPANTVRASHILIGAEQEKATAEERAAAKAKAEKILEELKKNPARFEEFVLAESTCPSKENGGSLGAFGKGRMVPEFEKVAFELDEGKLSEVVETQFGYHVIRRDASEKERTASFEEVKDELIEFQKGEKIRKAIEELLGRLYKENQVEILVKQPEPAEVPALQVQ